MDEDHDLPEDFDCPSLLCEELEDLETNNSEETTRGDEEVSDQGDNEETRVEMVHEDTKGGEEKKENQVVLSEKELTVMEQRVEDSQDVRQIEGREEESSKETNADKQKTKVTKGSEKKNEQKKSRKRRGKKQSDQVRNRRAGKDASVRLEEKKSQIQELPAMSSEENLALLEPSVGLLSNCDLSDSVYLGLGGTGVFCPPVSVPLLYSQPPVQIQPEPPHSHEIKRHHSPPQCHSIPPQNSQTLKMEITSVYSTRRSVRYNSRGRSRALSIPPLPESENPDSCLLPPAPKKKTRTLYSADQLGHLEALFQEDHYPDAEKRKVIAAAVGVTPQRIMVWFQNRRAKWRKVRSVTGKVEPSQSSSNPNHKINPSMTTLTANRKGVPAFSNHFAAALPQLDPTAPFPTQTPPSLSSLLDSLNSPGQRRGRDGGQQLSAQGGLPEYHPRPMCSPPPLRRASLPLFTSLYNSVSTNLPHLNNPAHTQPLFLDALEGSSSSSHCDTQTLQTDTSSLFDFAEKLSYPTSSQQSSSLLYQGQSSYPTRQQQQPHMAYLTLSPYLTSNPPDSNPTSYLTFGPGGNSSGVVTYSTMGHSYLPPQNSGQILLQPAALNSGMPAFASYQWNNLYTQPAAHQCAQHPPAYPSSIGSAPDHQIPTTSSLPQHSFFPLVDHGSSLQHSSRTQTQTDTGTFPPVSSLQPPHLRESTPNKASSSLLSSQVSSPSPESPTAPSCVKMESDSPREIHSHFHCDFSPLHF